MAGLRQAGIFVPHQLAVPLAFLYNIFVAAYQFFVQMATLWNGKAAEWVAGRKDLFQEIAAKVSREKPLIWVHSASAGEFEQAKPVIEAIKGAYPDYSILATFFSPSGFKAAKNYSSIDYRFYLPADTPANAKRFLDLVQPHLVLFVKYDFWYHHLKEVHSRNLPLVLVSAVFRPGQLFFRPYGGFYRKLLHFFTWIFVQDHSSLNLLQAHGIDSCSLGGDTRFDRVASLAGQFTEVPHVADFTGLETTLVAGSTWPGDEDLLKKAATEKGKLVLAPHEITGEHVAALYASFPNPVLYSNARSSGSSLASFQTLIIDNIGLLSRIYRYGTLAYIGGGFTRDGIHNILEAAVYGKPVIMGPNYKKYREARELIAAGGAFSVTNAEELKKILFTLLNNKAAYAAASEACFHYVQQNRGATGRVLQLLQEKRLLTR